MPSRRRPPRLAPVPSSQGLPAPHGTVRATRRGSYPSAQGAPRAQMPPRGAQAGWRRPEPVRKGGPLGVIPPGTASACARVGARGRYLCRRADRGWCSSRGCPPSRHAGPRSRNSRRDLTDTRRGVDAPCDYEGYDTEVYIDIHIDGETRSQRAWSEPVVVRRGARPEPPKARGGREHRLPRRPMPSHVVRARVYGFGGP